MIHNISFNVLFSNSGCLDVVRFSLTFCYFLVTISHKNMHEICIWRKTDFKTMN